MVTVHDEKYKEISISTCTLKEIIRTNGGRLIVHDLPDFPPIGCAWGQDTCYELAEYLVTLVSFDGEDYVNQLCQEHFDYCKKEIFNRPTDVRH